ncbi:hypothetical protein Mal4_07140 [Maioricimonas rarisocia]|uniref:Uncharacterized protein n=1 Tax=Maioricimonas rarisocia TaxID=2528026 RepID=A0A517Z1T5_9PLAN|nr:hypothetical protein Mal4_07140 [Maioricimonas rarisocia]
MSLERARRRVARTHDVSGWRSHRKSLGNPTNVGWDWSHRVAPVARQPGPAQPARGEHACVAHTCLAGQACHLPAGCVTARDLVTSQRERRNSLQRARHTPTACDPPGAMPSRRRRVGMPLLPAPDTGECLQFGQSTTGSVPSSLNTLAALGEPRTTHSHTGASTGLLKPPRSSSCRFATQTNRLSGPPGDHQHTASASARVRRW